MRLYHPRPTSVLAVYAHPDDADVAAGGALATFAREGASVHLVVVCQGDKGSHDSTEGVALPEVRRAEIESAGALLGLASVQLLGIPDGAVTNDDALRSRLVGVIRDVRPDMVIGPDPTAVFFGGVYVNHRDHRETGWALLDAVAPAASMPAYYPECGPAHGVAVMLLSGTHEPDVVVDVTGAIDVKSAAVRAHASQVAGDAEAVDDAVRRRAAQTGREVGVRYGEAFRALEFAR